MLLRPEARIVDFFDPEAVMGRLTNWCADTTHVIDIALVTGPGGQGKTRLAHELVRNHQELGWVAGFLGSDLIDGGPERDFAPIADTASDAPGILLVADYANTRPRQLIRLLKKLAGTTDLARVRLLLLARSSGDWWNELRREHLDIVQHARQIPLGSIVTTNKIGAEDFGATGGIRDVFKTAVRSYARADALPSIFPVPQHNWSNIAQRIEPPEDIEDPSYGSPLTLQLSALTALLQHANIIVSGQFATPEEVLLNHEETYWATSADAATLPFGPGHPRRWLSFFVATANLFRARTEAEAARIIGRLGVVSGDNIVVTKGIATWLHELYPPSDGREYWGSLQPDRLAEHHLGALASGQEDLLQMLFSSADPEEASRAVPLLTRAARGREALIQQLTDLLQAADLPCQAVLAPVLQEVTLPQRRYPANLDSSRQYVNYAGIPAPAGGVGGEPGPRTGPVRWASSLAKDVDPRRGDER